MNLVKVFLLTVLLAAAGAMLGGVLGMNVGRGGLLIGALLAGLFCVVASAFLTTRWRWITTPQRAWSIAGGAFGFALAWVVTVATVGHIPALIVSTLIVGAGAVLGAIVGISPHRVT